MNKFVWRKANILLIICTVLFLGGVGIANAYGNVREGDIRHRLIALAGVLIFIIFASAFLHILTSSIKKTINNNRLGAGRAATLEFILLVIGYIGIFIVSLELVGISVQRILLGSAVLGIILGVAAQQALANFFASIVLTISHPFMVGDTVTIVSGALGGKYKGKVVEIGFTHSHILEEESGKVVSLPNSTLLVNAAIKVQKEARYPKVKDQAS